MQCNKRGRGALCTYARGVELSGPPAPQVDSRKRVKLGHTVTENEIVDVPSRGPIVSGVRTRTESFREPDEEQPEGSDVPTNYLGRIHVKKNRSRYLGLGDRVAVLDHVSCYWWAFADD
jgi:hypothetical protein